MLVAALLALATGDLAFCLAFGGDFGLAAVGNFGLLALPAGSFALLASERAEPAFSDADRVPFDAIA